MVQQYPNAYESSLFLTQKRHYSLFEYSLSTENKLWQIEEPIYLFECFENSYYVDFVLSPREVYYVSQKIYFIDNF